MSAQAVAKVAETYSALRRARDPKRRLTLSTQVLDLLGSIERAVSKMRDEAVAVLRSEGASHAEIAQLAGVNRSRAAQLAQRTSVARGRRGSV